MSAAETPVRNVQPMDITESPRQRDRKDIIEILQNAKLSEDDVMPTSQALFFVHDNFYDNNYRLLELNNDLLEAVEHKQTLKIKGLDSDEVVICTDKKTFHVTATETSNSLLLARPLKLGEEIKNSTEQVVHKVEVASIFYEYLEAVIGRPHLTKLYELLEEAPYKGPEHEYDMNKNCLYTIDYLKDVIQASEEELKQGIKELDTVEIDGKIRILDFEYHFRVLSYMLKLIDENSWGLDDIDYEETINSLQELAPREVLNAIFDNYTEETKMIDGVQLYRYKETKVCQFFAKVLLREAGKFNLNEFLQAWKESVPEGMVPSEDMLFGIAIMNKKSNPPVIWALDEKELPDNIIERFAILFDAKEKWTVPEITPYIKRLTTERLDVSALLAKHARASTVDNVKYYSAKHAK